MYLGEEIKRHLINAKNPVMFEFGAHNGADVRRLAKITQGRGTIYAWEPDPINLVIFKQHVLPRNAILMECAISDTDGQSDFYPSINHKGTASGSSSLLKPIKTPRRPKNIQFLDKITIQTRSLDSFCKEHNITKIDLVLADIQGAEYKMIIGGKRMLKQTKFISMELMQDKRYEDVVLGVNNILSLLPEGWVYVTRVAEDIILRNRKYGK